jgi:hypothetical protein
MELTEATKRVIDGTMDNPSQLNPPSITSESDADYCRWADDGGNNLDD